MTARPTFAPLSVPRFRRLWLASMVSNLGSFLQSVAAAWLMLQLTGSPLWVGLMAASTTLPLLFLALPAGALADLVDRRRILLVSQVVMGGAALGMAVLWFAGLLTPGLLLGMGLLLGVGMAFTLPAWQAMVPDLVPRGLVPSAVALNSAGFNVARAVGPALGGLLVASAGPGAAFAVNAASYVGVVVAVASFKGGAWHDDQASSITSAIALGVRYARFTPPFRWLLLVASAFALTSAPLQALLPNITSDTLGGSAVVYGLLLGAMGTGALIGAFTRQQANARLQDRMVPVGIGGFGVAGVAVGLAQHPLLAGAAMVAAGVAWVWTLSTLNATAQLLSPAWVRGRVMSLYTLAFVGFLPLGAVGAGVIGGLVGASAAVTLLSAGALVLSFAALRLPVPVLDEVVPPEPPEDYEPASHVPAVAGGPVMVYTVFFIDEADLDAFLAVMSELRLVRLRTGAYRWRLYRDAADPHRMTEFFVLSSWEQHLAQHRRLDVEAVEVIRRAQAFDREGGPVTRHLAAVDVAHPDRRPDWEDLVGIHEALHRRDGSVPLGARRDHPARSA